MTIPIYARIRALFHAVHVVILEIAKPSLLLRADQILE
jgi:hypothetical protein